jgi:peptidoglycan/xylan/chitin deacetylase (PgdA/CDA1 family)
MRPIWRRLSSGGGVLCFHSLTSDKLPADGSVHVDRSLFEHIVRMVQVLGEIIPLRELLARHQRQVATAGLYSITFDDAYAGIEGGVRWLSELGLSATVFVVSEASRKGSCFWWDRIDDLHGRCSAIRWRQFEDRMGLPEAFREEQPPSLGPLRPLRQWVLAEHKGRWSATLESPLKELEQDLGYRTLQRAMTVEELARCSALPGIELGIHTATHPVLPLLSSEELEAEVRTCHAWLAGTFSNLVPILAIPFGLFDQRTVDVALGSGLIGCLSVQGHLLTRASKPAVPRLLVRRQEKPWKLALRLAGFRRHMVRRTSEYPVLPSAAT